MNKKQYNNVIEHTLNHEVSAQTEDSLETVRAIFNNMGVALPQGDMKHVYEVIKSDDYMGWKSCTVQEAQEAADNGTAAIGISEDRIVVLAANDEEEPVVETESVMVISENTSAYMVSNLQFYSMGLITTYYNKDYKGDKILTENQLALLKSNKVFYQNAEEIYGVPWKIIAAIHYREYGLRKEGPKNGNGPYQIWGSSYPVGTLTDAQFQQATNDAARFIKEKVGNRDLTLHDNVKYAFFAYNGTASAYKTQALNLGFTQAEANIGEGSPYVMNRAELKRDPTVEPTKSNRTWGQIKSDGGSIVYPANSDYGAYIVYRVL